MEGFYLNIFLIISFMINLDKFFEKFPQLLPNEE